jgi:hypothetical protein
MTRGSYSDELHEGFRRAEGVGSAASAARLLPVTHAVDRRATATVA